MSASKTAVASRLHIRRGLGEAEAALYIGLGATKFNKLVRERRMPAPRLLDGRRLWDIDDLDAAFRELPIEGDTADNSKPNSWDDLIP